jgi:hypothetical protein
MAAKVAAGKIRAIQCPNCSGTVTLRGFAHTLNAVCVQCLSVLDARSDEVRVLQSFGGKERVAPRIPLGSRGQLGGAIWEIIGFQTRQILVDGIPYEWREYLLFNPYQGFRYLTEFDGHWNFVRPLNGVPGGPSGAAVKAYEWQGRRYRHFQSARAETTFVLGEFPWQVRVGDSVMGEDYVSPPYILSSESTEGETTWSLGEYTYGATIFKAFQVQGSPPSPRGVFANQPSPMAGRVASSWRTFLGLAAALAVLFFLSSILMSQKEVFRQKYSFTSGVSAEPSYVTSEFDLDGRPSNVEIAITTDLENDWAYFRLALINSQSDGAYDLGREISYYHGRDSDGAWSEGSRKDTAIIPSVPAGRYYLRVEPEMDPNPPSYRLYRTMNYEMVVRRDVPVNIFFIFAAVLLVVPAIGNSIRAASFEKRRWAESDYGGGSDSEEDDDDD